MSDPSAPAPLRVGWASVDITPDRPVQLNGQFHERISTGVHDPLTATALALESAGSRDQALIVSVDVVGIPRELQEQVRAAVGASLPDLDVTRLWISATHTHTAPVFGLPTDARGDDWSYPPPPAGVTPPAEYRAFLAERLATAATAAWQARRPGGIGWGLGHAAVGFCRRVCYADGTARMYGASDTPEFTGMEGGNDHGVEVLCTWDASDSLTGVVANVACPSQVVEGHRFVSADFWSPARRHLRARYGERLFVLPQCAAAGDQSPRDLVRRGRAEADFHAEPGQEEMGQRVASAVIDVCDRTRGSIQPELAFAHRVEQLDLPMRKASALEAEQARAEVASLQQRLPADTDEPLRRMYARYYQTAVTRYQTQPPDPRYTMELHVVRIGDVAIATNPFELYLDYGLRIKARSRALQTLVVQLACDEGKYLPTARAVAGGHYGATIYDNAVGPEGGQLLVDRTVAAINGLFPDGQS